MRIMTGINIVAKSKWWEQSRLVNLGKLNQMKFWITINHSTLMNKLTLVIVGTFFMVGSAFAGGTVNWAVIGFPFMTAQTNSTAIGGSVGAMATSSSFYFELLYNTSFTGSQVAPPNFATLFDGTSWLDTGLTATNSTTVAGRLVPVNPNTARTVPWANGITNNIMLVGWSANLGTTWSAASNALITENYNGPAFFGESATGYLNPLTDDPGANVFGSSPQVSGLPINSPNTQLYLVVPEPSTIVLAGLGGLSLLSFYRRKK